ncbi:MAG: D-alanyl-D-alanine carboxypeptidase family protein [Clostridia bacterium]|jgi:D-alanyl-D-alanine carboxypeptidase (penicillin-binding protein 5/6)|nr:D-alanyl-D-alanine carboxypeptidase [Clostridia bacterium]MDD4276211.1 D-alanyl-D-alanine carboxypeptidase [Clostridia bacterium]
MAFFKRISKIFLICLTCFLIVNSISVSYIVQKYSYADALCSGKSMLVMESNSKRVLYSKNMNVKLPMASTTKVITALTVIINCTNLNEIIRINDKAVGVEGSSIYLKRGENISVIDLLYGLMLSSGNDSATALAYHVGGSIEGFASLMNNLAEKLGAVNSHFVNPHGLDNPEHYTTAYDLALISSYAINNDTFREIVSTRQKRIGEGDNIRLVVNKNKLLKSLDGAIGIKTGFTKRAGRCLVSAAERNGMRIVCVVLCCGPMFEESAVLINKAFLEFQNYEVLPPYQYITTIPVENGQKDEVYVYSVKSFNYPIKDEENININVIYDMPNKLIAPVEKNEIIGEIKVFYENHLIFSEKIYSMEEINTINILSGFEKIVKKW